jgi:hypothetical protein
MRELKDVPPDERGASWRDWMLARNAAEDTERKQALRARGYKSDAAKWEPIAKAPKEQPVVKQGVMFGERKAA